MRTPHAPWIRWAAGVAAALVCVGPAAAQLAGGAGLGRGSLGGVTAALPGLPLGDLPATGVPATVGELSRTADGATGELLANVRRLAIQRLIREHPDAVEADDRGAPVVRGEVLAIAPSAEALAAARQAGFSLARGSPRRSLAWRA